MLAFFNFETFEERNLIPLENDSDVRETNSYETHQEEEEANSDTKDVTYNVQNSFFISSIKT